MYYQPVPTRAHPAGHDDGRPAARMSAGATVTLEPDGDRGIGIHGEGERLARGQAGVREVHRE